MPQNAAIARGFFLFFSELVSGRLSNMLPLQALPSKLGAGLLASSAIKSQDFASCSTVRNST